MKNHTFRVSCSFAIQYTFTEDEVMADPEGLEGDLIPTEPALASLQADLAALIGEAFPISSVIIETDSDNLLGTVED